MRKLGLGIGVECRGDRGISLRWDEMVQTRGWFADIAKDANQLEAGL